MKISLNWIKKFVDVPEKYSAKELAELLTLRTCEVEGFENIGPSLSGLNGVVIGEVLSFERIQGTDSLHVGQINIGKQTPIQVVFGSMAEMHIGNRVPVAVAPTKLPIGINVEAKKIRGVLTEGMLCLDQELGLYKEGVSIQFFPNIAPGTPIVQALQYKQSHMYENIVVGKVLTIMKHPNADRLNLVEVNIGNKKVKIVCAGQNLVSDMVVAVALPDATTVTHEGQLMKISATKIRGEESFGMICADEELGLPKITKHPASVVISDVKMICAYLQATVPGIGEPFAKIFQTGGKTETDVVFEIDNKSLTHRPDLWGHFGMAREFAAIFGKSLREIKPKVNFPKTGEKVKIKFDKPNIASRFLSAIITGVKVKESPEWMQCQLEAIGVKPINNIVDVTNFVMHELGHPLHAFDRSVVGGDSFVIRFAKNGEIIKTLDHKKRVLTSEDALVTNGKKSLALAGIIGGLESEITPQTTEIILEVATWNPVMVRKTSSRLGLRTDAAQRFEKSLDPVISEIAFKRACELILEICKSAKLAGPLTDVYSQKYKPVSVTFDCEKAVKKIGAVIKESEMAEHLTALGFSVKKAKKGFLRITVPSWRATKDINIEDDLVEEIARMHGYEKIKPILPTLPIRLPRENRERNLKHFARQILSFGLGFDEISSYSFYGAEEISKCLLPREAHIGIENPLTEDQTHMRVSLLPNMLKAVKENLKWKKEFKIYEIGRSYIKQNDYFPLEEKFICGVVVRSGNDKEIFYDALGAVQNFLGKFGAKDFQIEKADGKNTPPYSHPSKCAIIKYRGKEIAVVYEIHPQILKNCEIASACAGFEINFTRLVSAGQTEPTYAPLPRFPGIEIDISVLADKKTEARQILELIKRADNALISNISLVDIFSGKSLGENKKSFTFRVLLQSPDRTLTDSEMKQIQEKIFGLLQKAGFAIRGL